MNLQQTTPAITFSVAASPQEYFQAELLLFSLGKFAKYPKHKIMLFVSQLYEQDDNYELSLNFTDYLSKHNYPFQVIGPDMSESFIEHQQALLFNTDMFVLGEFTNALPNEEMNLSEEVTLVDESNSLPYLTQKPFKTLHYQDRLTPFGLIDGSDIEDPYVLKAIETANKTISSQAQFEFFNDYKKSLSKKPSRTPASRDFGNKLDEILKTFMEGREQPLKLILHAGTPKSGTTSLQVYLDKKQQKLRGRGILYPNRFHNPHAPKHQWFERNLVQTNPENLLENFKNVLSHVDQNTHTIVLSSEGIYNRWWDFPEESRALLGELNKRFEINVWVWFREPLAFIESYYKQCIRNPQMPNIPCYGKDLTFAEMLNDSWFTRHLDYLGFIYNCQSLFGENTIRAFKYDRSNEENDIVQTVSEILGFATPHDNPTPRKNSSLNAAATEIQRVINRYQLKAKDKDKVIPHLKELNQVLSTYSTESLIDEESRERVIGMIALLNSVKRLAG